MEIIIPGMRGQGLKSMAALLAAALLAGCQTNKPVPFAELPGAGGTNSSGTALASDPIRVGETLLITFTDTAQPILPVQEKVKEDGTITLLYNQSFHVVGKSVGELNKEIRARYVPDYFAQLTAAVVQLERQRLFYVDGEVKAPSRQQYTGPITVTQAITACGGFTDFADKRHVQLIRSNGKVLEVNCKKALKDTKLDLEVYPGDKIWVPRSIL